MGNQHKKKDLKRSPISKLSWMIDSPWVSLALIAALAFIGYSNSFFTSFHFDDESSIVFNPAIHDLGDLNAIWHNSPTRFLTYLSFGINYRLGGLNVVGYHVVNLALHIGCGFLVWLLLRQLLGLLPEGGEGGQGTRIAPIIAALIFVLHPLQTQAVTYIVQRATVLATVFYLSSVYFFIEARLSQRSHASVARTAGLFATSACTGILGLFSKEIILTLPFALLLVDFYFLSPDRKFNWKFGGVILLGFLTFSAVMIGMNLVSLEDAPAISQVKYISTQPQVMLTYIRLAFLPYDQNLDHSISIAQTPLELSTMTSAAGILLLLAAAVMLFRRHRLISFGIVWFFIVLLPESSVLPLSDVMFEHRMYLPMFGVALLTIPALDFGERVMGRGSMIWIFAAIISMATYLTYERNKVWKDEVTLWSDVISKSPGKGRAYTNRGRALGDLGRFQEALGDFNRAIALDPTNSDAYNNRANIYVQNGRADDAIADCNRALEVAPRLDFQLAKIYFNRGTAYVRKNQISLALKDLDEALNLDPNNESAHFNRAIALSRSGDFRKALDDYTWVIKMNPGHSRAFNNRGGVYRELGMLNEALEDFQRSIALQPDYGASYINRGIVLKMRGQLDESLRDLNTGIRLLPNSFDAYYNRGIVRFRRKEYREAIADFSQAIQLNGGNGDAFIERARARFAFGDTKSAEEDLQQARRFGLKIDPSAIIKLRKGKN